MQAEPRTPYPHSAWRERWYRIIFEAETPAGKRFDVVLLVLIVVSILAVVAESVRAVSETLGPELRGVEWTLTVLFTLEYLARLLTAPRPLRYARSFLGIIDLLALLPTYLSLVLDGSQALLVVRALRLLRVFRILKLYRYFHEVEALVLALRRSRTKIVVFLLAILTIVLIMGSTMYVVEGAENGFSSIPQGMYWAVVTITTVGYGDIAPKTVLGQTVAALAMVLGYAVIIIPTGIFSYELSRAAALGTQGRPCGRCNISDHELDALYCRRCGERLPSLPEASKT